MKILIAEDELDLLNLLRRVFQDKGYEVFAAPDGEIALRVFNAQDPDLVILDLMMPKRSGLQVLKEIRRDHPGVPVIILTAVGDQEHIIELLDAGADDYMVKPFYPREVLARASAVMRRHPRFGARERTTAPITCGAIIFDPMKKEVRVAGQLMDLTPTELSLLEYFILNCNRVISVEELLTSVWDYEKIENDAIVRVNVARLRGKLEPDPANPRYLRNVPGEGYILVLSE